jgi:hypothetical protein
MTLLGVVVGCSVQGNCIHYSFFFSGNIISVSMSATFIIWTTLQASNNARGKQWTL